MELSRRFRDEIAGWKIRHMPGRYPPYVYTKLDSSRLEIRVLDVLPGAGMQMIECTLRIISLAQKPTPLYEAISYCWGSSNNHSVIKLDGKLTQAPWSSVAAIRRMRLPHDVRTLWIDAICIDQSCVRENDEQVALMSSIYRTGQRNLIYLGENDGTAKRAVKAIETVTSDMREATENFDSGTIRQVLYDVNPEWWEIRSSKEGFEVDLDRDALQKLYERP